MVRYIKHSEIDFEKYDQCIDKAINGIIYPYSWYISQLSPKWNLLVLDDYKAVMPLPHKKKWGMHYILQPLFVQQLGVFSTLSIGPDDIEDFVANIPNHYKFVHYNFNTFNSLPKSKNYKKTRGVTYELDLIGTIEQIRKNYNQNTKRNLKKAHKQKVFITKNADPEQIIEMFRNQKGSVIKSITEESYHSLKHLLHSSLHRGNMCAYAAYNNKNELCAGGVFLHSHNKSILILAASTNEGKKNGAMTRIIDFYLEEYAETNTVLDFEGSNIQNIARFYRGFGAKKCIYHQLSINNFPWLLKPFFQLYYNYKVEKG